MVIVRLNGGLGNQMFQYACGRAVAQRWRVPLKLDISGFPDHSGRTYELGRLPIRAAVATDEECRRLRWRVPGMGARLWARVRGRVPSRRPGRAYYAFKERICEFEPAVFERGPDVYLDGYFQSWKYFQDIAEKVREELTPPLPLSDTAKQMAGRIAGAGQSVSVHFRRTDYVSQAHTRAFHGGCSHAYYEKAAAEVMRGADGVAFFAFSDDPEWVRANVSLGRSFVVVPGGHQGWEDLWLMSRCRHHIIANSSFSWWAAWLDPSPDKLVIAPKQWFADPEQDASDLYPDGWVKV